jgi:hypothetical protein
MHVYVCASDLVQQNSEGVGLDLLILRSVKFGGLDAEKLVKSFRIPRGKLHTRVEIRRRVSRKP